MLNDPGPRYTAADKIDAGHAAMNAARSQGASPVAASVVGSALRGLDHPGSDRDVMVAVTPGTLRRPRPLRDAGDAVLVPLDYLVTRLGVSVQYAEWAASPYLVGDTGWLPYVRALRPDRFSLAKHGLSLARNSVERSSLDPRKAARFVLANYLFVSGISGPVQPRNVFDLSHPLAPAAGEWVADGLDGASDKLTEVAALLRA